VAKRYWQICRSDEIDEPGCREFELEIDGTTLSGFILRWQGRWYAYRNSCPHTGVPLNWLPDQFFDIAQEFVQCSMHGALFRPHDGLCIRGPCLGRSLTGLAVTQRDGEILLDHEGLNSI